MTRTTSPTTADVTLTLDDGTAYPQQGTLQFQRSCRSIRPPATVTLRAQFPNPDGVLLPGMFVRATIIEGIEPNALLVPQRGVSRDERGNATALIVDADGVVQSRKLTVAQTVGTNWLVKSGIDRRRSRDRRRVCNTRAPDRRRTRWRSSRATTTAAPPPPAAPR